MAARRVRIKGIANIPIRRKNESSITDKINDNKNDNTIEQVVDKSIENNVKNNEDITCKKGKDLKNVILSETKDYETEITNCTNIDSIQDNLNSVNNILNSENNTITTSEAQNIVNNSSIEKSPPKNLLNRRRIAKPLVKLPAITRKPKSDVLEYKHNENNIINTEKSTSNDRPSVIQSPNEKSDQSKTVLSVNIQSKSNYAESSPQCPLSPSKTVNRARIRPIPRLIRRNSIQGSASESEDDLRKSFNRSRNDSVCSVSSYDVTKDDNTAVKERKTMVVNQRKIKYTEQSRKIAMARKEFNIKFGSQLPDRKKLTMMDLIFYNPTTNPMTEKNTTVKDKEIVQPLNIEQEEKEDDPDNLDDAESDEENIPVPQVKVGPDGEIILDEKSLVIEQTGTKKGREQIENSEIIIDDSDFGCGLYKRPKRTKDWSVTETLRFYRTLNTVGTDFSLMLSLFPGRTRRELKLKFKKEERINRVLIDRVLMNPLDFNLTELEEQFQAEEDDKKKNKEAKKPKEKDTLPQKKKRAKRSMLSKEIEDENECNPVRKKFAKLDKKNDSINPYTVLENGIDSIIDSDSADEEFPNQSNSKIDDKFLKRPTRQCRLNKPSNYSSALNSEDESEIENIVIEDVDEYNINKNSNKTDDINIIKEHKKNENENLIAETETLSQTNEITEINNTKNDFDNQLIKKTVISHTNNSYQVEDNHNDLLNNNEKQLISNDKEDNMEIETNVVIAHSENSELDRISIDIVSKNMDTIDSSKFNQTKVSLELKKQGENLIEIDNNLKISSVELTKKLDEVLEKKSGTKISIPSENSIQKFGPEGLPQMEPGSLMILSNSTPSGEKVFKVYMVTPNKENIPVDLSPDIVQSLTTTLGSAEEIVLDLPVISK